MITITCPPLVDAPRNGDIDCSLGDDGEANPGDSCTYTCDNGFGLQDGSTTRTCQNDGTWSGTEPRCRRGIVVLIICRDAVKYHHSNKYFSPRKYINFISMYCAYSDNKMEVSIFFDYVHIQNMRQAYRQIKYIDFPTVMG